MSIKPEDYLEPTCPFCVDAYQKDRPIHRIDLCRMMEKLDEYLGRNDYVAAERHLNFWLSEARFNNDDQGALSVLNELMGLHRKCGHEAQAMEAVQDGLSLLDSLDLEGTVTAGTTFVNAATVYKAFGKAVAALPLYRKAQEIYEQHLSREDGRLGGLYNNMALALVDEKQYAEARRYYEKALDVMANVKYGQLEQAITYLNLADLATAELGLLESEEQVNDYLNRAEALLQTPEVPHNGYYAFVCEKCAPTFRYFGRFAYADELKQRSDEIYERS